MNSSPTHRYTGSGGDAGFYVGGVGAWYDGLMDDDDLRVGMEARCRTNLYESDNDEAHDGTGLPNAQPEHGDAKTTMSHTPRDLYAQEQKIVLDNSSNNFLFQLPPTSIRGRDRAHAMQHGSESLADGYGDPESRVINGTDARQVQTEFDPSTLPYRKPPNEDDSVNDAAVAGLPTTLRALMSMDTHRASVKPGSFESDGGDADADARRIKRLRYKVQVPV